MSDDVYRAAVGEPVGHVLVTHGLNTRPAVMDQLIEPLRAAGLGCLRVSLHPTGGGGDRSAEHVRRRWSSAVSEAYERLRAEEPALPVHALGYSLGAVVSVAYLASSRTARFDRMVLLAPPFAMTRTARLVRALTPLSGTGLALPSAAPRTVRQRRGTPLSEYAALLSLVSSVQELPDSGRIGFIPTRVVVDPGDELVSARGVERWVTANGLTEWSVSWIRERRSTRRTYRHLVVTEEALGPQAWDRLTRDVVGHLVGHGAPRDG